MVRYELKSVPTARNKRLFIHLFVCLQAVTFRLFTFSNCGFCYIYGQEGNVKGFSYAVKCEKRKSQLE